MNLLTEIGVGGAIAIIIIREAFGFVKNFKNDKSSNGYITRNELEEHKKYVQYKDNCNEIVKRIESEFRAIEDRDKTRVRVVDENFKSMREEFREVKSLIINGNK